MRDPFLASCEAEVLHRSGAIIADGTLLVLGPDARVTHVGENVGALLGGEVADWLGAALPPEFAEVVATLRAEPGSRSLLERAFGGPAGPLDLVATRAPDGSAVVELLPHAAEEGARSRSVALRDLGTSDEARAAAEAQLVETVAELTGFGRAMLYRFREDGDGEVVAEARGGDAFGSYLGLRFPASDIPRIARELYAKNPWRLIPDSAAEPVALVGRGPEAPDLTYADLRSVSPVHRVYLANMGVRASLSFPVMLGGALGALVACHHDAPRRPPLARLELAARAVRDHAIATGVWHARRRMTLLDGLERRFAAARHIVDRHGGLAEGWAELGPWLMAELDADGAVFCDGDLATAAGMPIAPEALEVLDTWFCDRRDSLVWRSESLVRDVPEFPLSEVAGALAVRLHRGAARALRVYLLRREHLHDVSWGGRPDKPVEHHDGQLGIAPRRSFERWIEKRFGHSRAWDAESQILTHRLRELLIRSVGR